jgi:hypothetical protein
VAGGCVRDDVQIIRIWVLIVCSLIPKISARCSGSNPVAMASVSWQSIRGRSTVGGQAAQAGEVGGAHGAVVQCGPFADQQVRIGGVRPPAVPVLEPLAQDLAGQLAHRPVFAGEAQPPAGEFGIAELQCPDRGGPGRVQGGEDDADEGLRGGRRGDGALRGAWRPVAARPAGRAARA